MVGWQRCKSLGPSLDQHQRAEQAGKSSAREQRAALSAARSQMGAHMVFVTRMLNLVHLDKTTLMQFS